MLDPRKTVELIDRRLERLHEHRPDEARIHKVDGDRADIQPNNSPAILRHVEIIGDPQSLRPGDIVPIRWMQNGRPQIILTASSETGSGYGGSLLVPDNMTIENSAQGLRVKGGSIGLEHLSFDPLLSDEGQTGLLAEAGWEISADGVIFNEDTFIHPNGMITLGNAGNVIKLSALDDTYRLWAGNVDPELASFKVSKLGEVIATAGSIAGWDILADKLAKNNVELDPTGQIKVGVNDDVAILNSVNANDWRFWIGHSDPEQAPFRVKKTGEAWFDSAHVAQTLESANYQSGVQGWHLDQAGWIEAQDVIIRGRVVGMSIAQKNVAAIGGRMDVAETTVFIADATAGDTTIDVAEQVFEQDDLIKVQPDINRNEWMRIMDDGTAIADGWRYQVTRALSGTAFNFYSGETITARGAANLPDPADRFGEGEFAKVEFGGSGFRSQGGWLTLEGSRQYGPYFGVALRFGAAFNQIADVARLGRLKGFLQITADDYGVGIGSLDQHLLYTYRDGLEIVTDGGSTTIDQDGVATEKFGIRFAPEAPTYTDQMVRFWVENRQIKVKIKDGAFEAENIWFDFDEGGSIANAADKVDGFHAAASATPNTLLALDGAGKLPADITGDAWTLQGNTPSAFADVVHSHVETDITDLDKYSQAQVDSLLTGKSDTGHTHDSRYYTESEVDAELASLGLGDLSNVDLAGLVDGETIIYNQAQARFEPGSGGGGSSEIGVENLLANGGFGDDLIGWTVWDGSGLISSGYPAVWDNVDWSLRDRENGATYGNTATFQINKAFAAGEYATFYTGTIPVLANEWYTAQARAAEHRITGANGGPYIRIVWLNESLTVLSYDNFLKDGSGTNYINAGGGTGTANFDHMWVAAQAPSTAAYMRVEVVLRGYDASLGTNGYVFLDHFKVERGTVPTPYDYMQIGGGGGADLLEVQVFS